MEQKQQTGFMDALAAFIVRYRWVILGIFAAAMVFSCFSASWVKLEEDITYYLQDSSEAKRGLTIMDKEFDAYATAQVMVKDITPEAAEKLPDELSAIENVSMVDYVQDADHYKDGCALYDITFNGAGTDQAVKDAMEKIRGVISDYDSSVYCADMVSMNDIFTTEMLGVLIIVVIVVTAVLLFTSSTYAEILVLLATFLAAAVVNMGTNFMLGTISFISNAIALVLQLALSVDYAIIFCNRYKEEHQLLPIREAVISALAKSIPAISASSLTTIAGLAAMTFMEFKLGLDMGIMLIKAIVFSLLSVFLFMPAMLMLCGNLMDKTRHRSFIPKVSFLGKFAYATRFIIPPIFVVLVVVACYGYNHSNYCYDTGSIKTFHQNEMDIAKYDIEDHFGHSNLVAMIIPSGDYEKEAQLSQELKACPQVKNVLGLASIEGVDGYHLTDKVGYKEIMDLADVDETSAKALLVYSATDNNEYRQVQQDLEGYTIPIIDMFLSLHEIANEGGFEDKGITIKPDQLDMINDLYGQLSMARDQLEGEHYSRILVYSDLPGQGDDTFAFLDELHTIAGKYYDPDEVVLTGDSVSAKDFCNAFETDNRIVSLLSIALVMLILFFTFRSVAMPLLLILVIQGSIWMNFAIPAFRGNLVFFMCFLIVGSIQMGANIDYAIVISTRYNELRGAGASTREAIIETLNLAFPTVITSGTMMVVAGLMIGFRVSECVIAGMGMYVGTGTAISLVLVNFVLPQILIFGDKLVRSTTLRLPHVSIDLSRIARGAVALLLAALSAAALIVAPASFRSASDEAKSAIKETSTLVEEIDALDLLSRQMGTDEQSVTQMKMDFTEHLLTDIIGNQEMTDGQKEYDEGEKQLSDAQKELANGQKEYNEGYAEYQSKLDEYNAGKAQVEQGQKDYDQGLRDYEAGKKKLADGQKKYDEGVKELADAKKQYAEGKKKLEDAEDDYNTALPLYNDYMELKKEYNAIKNSTDPDDIARAEKLASQISTSQRIFSNMLDGQDIEDVIKEYQDGQKQLKDAEKQIADGEKELKKAKKELDDGKKELADAEKQLKDAKKQLDDGKAQLKDGEKQLAEGKAKLDSGKKELDSGKKEYASGQEKLSDAKKQLDDGKKTLEENSKSLQADLSRLDEMNSDREKVEAGVAALMAHQGLSDKVEDSSTTAELCSIAKAHFLDQQTQLERQAKMARVVSMLMFLSAVLALLTVLVWLVRHSGAASVLSILAGVASVVGAALWHTACAGCPQTLFWIAVGLALCALVGALLLFLHSHEDFFELD